MTVETEQIEVYMKKLGSNGNYQGQLENLCRYINGIFHLGCGILDKDIELAGKILDGGIIAFKGSELEGKLQTAKNQFGRLCERVWPRCRRESLIP